MPFNRLCRLLDEAAFAGFVEVALAFRIRAAMADDLVAAPKDLSNGLAEGEDDTYDLGVRILRNRCDYPGPRYAFTLPPNTNILDSSDTIAVWPLRPGGP